MVAHHCPSIPFLFPDSGDGRLREIIVLARHARESRAHLEMRPFMWDNTGAVSNPGPPAPSA